MTIESTSVSGPTITSPIVMGGESPTVTSPVTTTNPAPPEPAPAAATTTETPAVSPEPAPVAATVEPAPSPAPTTNSTPEWAQKRINELTAKRYEAERNAATAEAARLKSESEKSELQRMLEAKTPSPSPAPANTPPALTQEQIDQLVLEKASQIAAANDFNKACNTIAETGKKEFKDWDDSLKNLGLVGAVGQNVSPEFLETAIELKSPHKVLHYLGQNLEEAERIIKLSPKKMALEMARVEAQLNAPAPVAAAAPISSAPAPVIPLAGAAKAGAPVDINDPNASMEDWMILRQKQQDERRKRYQRV